jgi:ABC-type nitrate/sulfonate/bicarbonate transport system substrate-binding protein
MKRLTLSLLAPCALFFATAQPLMANEKLIKVTAGHLIALDMAPLFVGVESGCFKHQGLEVDTRFFANPGDNNAALAGGAIDFSTNPFTLPFFAANSGVPIKVISAAGGWGVMEVIADGKLGLDSIDALAEHVKAGKPKLTAAVLQGDTLELILVAELAKQGMAPDAIEFVYFNDLLAMVEAFRSGNVDILSHIKPYTSQMVASRGATVLTNNASTWSNHTPNTVVSVLDKTLTERPEVVTGYLKGLICAAEIINTEPEKAIDLLEQGNYFRVSREVLKDAFASAPEPISFTPDVAAVQQVVDALVEMQYVRPGVSAESIFEIDLIKSLEQ